MPKFKRLTIWILALAAVCAFLEFAGRSSAVRSSVLEFSPVQKLAGSVCNFADDWVRGFLSFRNLSEANRVLQQQNAGLLTERASLLRLKIDNLRLKALLELKEELPSGTKICAQVIARDPNNWSEEVTLDKGSEDGVSAGMAAVTPEGLVGRVSAVSRRSCRLLLLSGSRLRVPVALSHSRACGVLITDRLNHSVVKYVRCSTAVRSGELVVTSGLGDVYPGGLAVGRSSSFYAGSEAMYQDIQITLSVDFASLREVILIKKEAVSANPAIFEKAIAAAEEEARKAAKEAVKSNAAILKMNQSESGSRSVSDYSGAPHFNAPSEDGSGDDPAPSYNASSPESGNSSDAGTPASGGYSGGPAGDKDGMPAAAPQQDAPVPEAPPRASESAGNASGHYITVDEHVPEPQAAPAEPAAPEPPAPPEPAPEPESAPQEEAAPAPAQIQVLGGAEEGGQ